MKRKLTQEQRERNILESFKKNLDRLNESDNFIGEYSPIKYDWGKANPDIKAHQEKMAKVKKANADKSSGEKEKDDKRMADLHRKGQHDSDPNLEEGNEEDEKKERPKYSELDKEVLRSGGVEVPHDKDKDKDVSELEIGKDSPDMRKPKIDGIENMSPSAMRIFELISEELIGDVELTKLIFNSKGGLVPQLIVRLGSEIDRGLKEAPRMNEE